MVPTMEHLFQFITKVITPIKILLKRFEIPRDEQQTMVARTAIATIPYINGHLFEIRSHLLQGLSN